MWQFGLVLFQAAILDMLIIVGWHIRGLDQELAIGMGSMLLCYAATR